MKLFTVFLYNFFFFFHLWSPSLLADEAEDSEVEELRDFLKAEEKGRLQGECHKTFSECPQSMFELLPFMKHKIFHI